MLVWVEFLVCAGAIWAAGSHLSQWGDVIAEKSGFSRGWIGLVLLASVTSLPELVTGLSAVTLAEAPDIAVGNALGACVMNLLIIAILDLLEPSTPVLTRVGQGHILSAGFGILLLGSVGLSMLLIAQDLLPAIGHVSVATPLLLAAYAVAVRTFFRYERRERAAYVEEAAERYRDVTLRQAVLRYAAAALVVVVAGIWLPFVGAHLAEVMGWERTFVGTLFVAVATTLPEMVVTVSAVQLGAVDLAIGNLFGSNLFDVALVGVDDLFFLRGPLLASVSPLHVLTALTATTMTGAAVVALLYRPEVRLVRAVGWVSLLLVALFVLNAWALFRLGA